MMLHAWNKIAHWAGTLLVHSTIGKEKESNFDSDHEEFRAEELFFSTYCSYLRTHTAEIKSHIKMEFKIKGKRENGVGGRGEVGEFSPSVVARLFHGKFLTLPRGSIYQFLTLSW